MEAAEKRRGWVRTAAIVFFVLLLLLTFFSNTILNWSLPEVSAEMAERFSRGDKASLMGVKLPKNAAAILRGKELKAGDISRTELVFDIQNVNIGAAVYITLGARGTQYPAVVPNSAIRQDVSGLFVLTLEETRTPLGNRYVAQRVNVTLLDRDDANAAVSGGIKEGDTVIINSSKPLEPGLQVKLA